jgi:hypothetical protein
MEGEIDNKNILNNDDIEEIEDDNTFGTKSLSSSGAFGDDEVEEIEDDDIVEEEIINKVAVESIRGIETPNLFFDEVSEQFYQPIDTLCPRENKIIGITTINGTEMINFDNIDMVYISERNVYVLDDPPVLTPLWEIPPDEGIENEIENELENEIENEVENGIYDIDFADGSDVVGGDPRFAGEVEDIQTAWWFPPVAESAARISEPFVESQNSTEFTREIRVC